MGIESSFGKVPQEKPKMKKIPIEGGGEISLSPEEIQQHEQAEKRRLTLERLAAERKKTPETEAQTAGKTLDELTEEEMTLLKKIVPDDETRAKLDPEVIEMFLRAEKDERKEAA